MHDTTATEIDAPFDSGDFPKSVLVNIDDGDTCGGFPCAAHVSDWPRGNALSSHRPAAMFQADLYCADCMPLSYDETTGERVSTLTGIAR